MADIDPIRLRGEVQLTRRLTSTHRHIHARIIGAGADGLRVDKFLSLICPSLTRSLFQLWISRGEVQVNGQQVSAARRLRKGDEVRVSARLPPNPSDLDQRAQALQVLLEEPDFLVVDKPPGQLVHQAGRVFHGTLLGQLQAYLEARGQDPEEARLVNRIDRETSGLVLVGLSADTQRALSKALQRRDVEKTYLALCHGRPQPDHGHWHDPIGPGIDGTPKRMVRADGQACHTEYQVCDSAAGISLLRITLHTGRQHQIRLHAAHNGHPLVGDWLYGCPCSGLPGQALHAHRLSFTHPHSGQLLSVESPLHPGIRALWQAAQSGQAPAARELSSSEHQRLKDPEHSGPPDRRLPQWLSAEQTAAVRAEASASGHQQVDRGSRGEDDDQGIE